VIWVADYNTRTVEEIDPRTSQPLASIVVGGGPSAIAVGAGSVRFDGLPDRHCHRLGLRHDLRRRS
jgi:hypothetical protein